MIFSSTLCLFILSTLLSVRSWSIPLACPDEVVVSPIPPTISCCSQLTLSWTGGVPPYNIWLVHNATSSHTLKRFPPQHKTRLHWTVDFPEGTKFRFFMDDCTWWESTVTADLDNNCSHSASSVTVRSLVSTTDSSAAASTPSEKIQESKKNAGAIVGGVLGGLAFLAIIGFGSCLYSRHQRKQESAIRAARLERGAILEDRKSANPTTSTNRQYDLATIASTTKCDDDLS